MILVKTDKRHELGFREEAGNNHGLYNSQELGNEQEAGNRQEEGSAQKSGKRQALQTLRETAKRQQARTQARTRQSGFHPLSEVPHETVHNFPAVLVDGARRHGRGSVSNASGRFEPLIRSVLDDGWESMAELPPFKTEVVVEKPKTIISRNTSPDLEFDRSINPYRGCEHGCIYCYARPTHAYMGLSPGLDFETRLFAKDGAEKLLERELSAPGYQPRMIAMGTNTDPYQPIERERQIMRRLLQVLAKARHPVGIVTKSALVLRDLDILAPMAQQGLAKVALSITTLDSLLARRMEPRASTPAKRLDAVRQLVQAGVPAMVMAAPMIPALNDHEMEQILEKAAAAGATEAGFILLRLPLELRDLFREWLLEHYPGKLRHVLSLVQSTRNGKDYDARFGFRQTGEGTYAELMAKRFHVACQRLGLNRKRRSLRCDLFVRPVREGAQLTLF